MDPGYSRFSLKYSFVGITYVLSNFGLCDMDLELMISNEEGMYKHVSHKFMFKIICRELSEMIFHSWQ